MRRALGVVALGCIAGEGALWDDYQAFAARDLAEFEVSYFFVDGIAENKTTVPRP